MTRQALERANQIDKILKNIDTARLIMTRPYPSFCSVWGNDCDEASFHDFDNDTIGELKDAINAVLDHREKVLREEMKAL